MFIHTIIMFEHNKLCKKPIRFEILEKYIPHYFKSIFNSHRILFYKLEMHAFFSLYVNIRIIELYTLKVTIYVF